MNVKTLGAAFEISGIGLHSGFTSIVRVVPAAPGEGRYFVRVDLPEAPKIPAKVPHVHSTKLSTQLRAGDATVQTVEHLLAALAACGIDNARIEIDSPEVPLLDGSAEEWVKAIAFVGYQETEASLAHRLVINEPVWIHQGDTFVAALPAAETRFTYGIDFEYSAIGNQWYSFCLDKESFVEAIAPARTFTLANQIEQLRQAGLIKGGNLENALVCDQAGWLNPPLRFDNEPVRHKLLDLMGDLSLLGRFPQAHFVAYKAGHHLHIQLAQTLLNLK